MVGVIICLNKETTAQSFKKFLNIIACSPSNLKFCLVDNGVKEDIISIYKEQLDHFNDNVIKIKMAKSATKAKVIKAGYRYLYHLTTIKKILFIEEKQNNTNLIKQLQKFLQSHDDTSAFVNIDEIRNVFIIS